MNSFAKKLNRIIAVNDTDLSSCAVIPFYGIVVNYWEPSELLVADTEECGTYFIAKIIEAFDEVENLDDLPRYNTVEELFKELDS